MRTLIMTFCLTVSMVGGLFAQFDLSFLPSYEHRVYHREDDAGTVTNHTYLRRKGDTVYIYATYYDANINYSFRTDGTPLRFREWDKKGNLMVSVDYNWDTKKLQFMSKKSGETKRNTVGMKNNMVCAYMVSEVFRGFPWKKEKVDFKIFSGDKDQKIFDATLKVAKKNHPVKTEAGVFKTTMLKMSAGIGFIKFEQKYEFYFDQGEYHPLTYYDGVDALDKRLVSSMELFQTK